MAQQSSNNSDDADATELETVEVVGSRIKRSNIEGPSPVVVITAEQIEREGFSTVHDAIESLAANTGSVQNDFNSAGGFTPNAGVVNLRGLGPGRTLLLINGRRANDYPFPYNGRSNFQNFNNIPAGAVARIEVLAGGASAIYGSDAVAGVVNVVLKKDYEGDMISIKGTTTQAGGASTMDLQWTGGKVWDGGSLTYAFEHYNRSPLFAWQRDFMDSAEDNPYPALIPGVGNVYQPPIGIQVRVQGVPTAGSYIMPFGANCQGSDLYQRFTYRSTASGVVLGDGCGYDRYPAEQTVVNGQKDSSGYLYGNLDFSDTVSGWASLMFFHSDAELGGGVEQWFGLRPNVAHYDPNLGLRVLAIRALTPETYGGPEGTFQKFTEDSWDFAAGLRGTFGDRFDWDFTVSHAEYKVERTRPRMTIQGAADYFLGPQLGVTGSGAYAGIPGMPNGVPVFATRWDRFFGPISAADYWTMATQVEYDAKSENSGAQFVVSGDMFELPGGTSAFAAVAEWSTQSYRLNSDERILPTVASIYNLTGTGGGGDRDRYAFGVETSFPIFSMLTITAAARYDKYDDITNVDDAITWNGGIEFRPFDNLLIRGAYATSFKAPDMHYVFSERSGSFGQIVDYVRCARDGIAPTGCSGAGAVYNYQAFTTSEGQPGLKEETGRSWSAGLVWDITDQLSFSADYYDIELEDEVAVLSGTTILSDEYGCRNGVSVNGAPFPYAPGSAYCAEILNRLDRDPLNDDRLTEIRSGPINQAYRRVKGIDASLSYGWDTDNWGNFRARIDWSHTLEQILIQRAGDTPFSYRDDNGNVDFRSRVRVTMGWSKDDWDATVFVNRYGSQPRWILSHPDVVSGELDDRAPPHTTVNLSIGRQWTENLSMRLNINNVFDDVSPEDRTFNTYPYFWRAYSPLGREFGLTIAYKF
ncbi:hypothetical protein P873_12830 [Arenimonas composti TR7-09 = DSM 18010]|uniref:TonB-dependent receptor n=2 Tax=Arenimonas TaxID=490567 RepID=A0A091B8R9_9GAMM|nr:hypothetical protein P873_12830 [Arenimonas composti TR7-09 = DSM 18010]